MQINGVNEFLSQFTPRVDQLGAKNVANPFVISPQKDFLDISEIGKRLSFRSNETAKLDGVYVNTGGDPILKLVNQGMIKMENLLEKMKALTVAAQDENLSDLERIEMQIEMEKLRKEVKGIMFGMEETYNHWQNTGKMGNLPPLSEVRSLRTLEDERKWLNRPENYDGYSLLERARDRILKGEKWDIREKFDTGYDADYYERVKEHLQEAQKNAKEPGELIAQAFSAEMFGSAEDKKSLGFELAEVRIGNESFKAVDGKLEGVHLEDASMKIWNAIPYDGYDSPLFGIPHDTYDTGDPYEQGYYCGLVRGRWVPTDDKNFLTVREKIEQSNTINLMDAKSAAKGTERLDNEIEAFRKMREEFVTLCESQAENKENTSVITSVTVESVEMYKKVHNLFKKFVGAFGKPLQEMPRLGHLSDSVDMSDLYDMPLTPWINHMVAIGERA